MFHVLNTAKQSLVFLIFTGVKLFHVSTSYLFLGELDLVFFFVMDKMLKEVIQKGRVHNPPFKGIGRSGRVANPPLHCGVFRPRNLYFMGIFILKDTQAMMNRIQTGLERLFEAPPNYIENKRLGLLCNPASVDRNFVHARIRIDHRFPGQLKALFSPQHGFFAEKQDNMITSDDLIDPSLKIPIFSLYGKSRIPTKDMFAKSALTPIDFALLINSEQGSYAPIIIIASGFIIFILAAADFTATVFLS